MKKLLLCFLLFIGTQITHAQQTPPPPPPPVNTDSLDEEEGDTADSSDFDREFKTVQVEAKFPGGTQGWINFLQKNLHADVPRKKKAPKGSYTVMVSFLVDKKGKVYETQLLTDPGYGCGEEVLRILKKSPDWSPAIQDDRPVIYRQKQSVTFIVE